MKNLKTILSKKSGRDSQGHVSVRHQGGRHKRYLRKIDFKRDKTGVWGTVETIEGDPNRNAYIAQILYEDGERRYILAPNSMKAGQKVISGDAAPIEPGNTLSLSLIPVGTPVHNVEIRSGMGGQLVKGAGAQAVVFAKEDKFVLLKMPSGEIRRFDPKNLATIGQVGNIEAKAVRIGKAGRKRRMGIRPTVRGTAQHPNSHPHGGGEGRSGVGMKYPKTPYGKPAVGKTRKKRKYSNRLIVKPRKKGKHS